LSWLFDVSTGYLSTAFTLTPEQWIAVRRGERTLSSIHNARRAAASLDQTINRAVAKFGIDHIVDAVSVCASTPAE
jgi:hypothetical protein